MYCLCTLENSKIKNIYPVNIAPLTRMQVSNYKVRARFCENVAHEAPQVVQGDRLGSATYVFSGLAHIGVSVRWPSTTNAITFKNYT